MSMPQHKKNVKRMRTNDISNQRNRTAKSTQRTVIRTVLDTKDKTTVVTALQDAISIIDKNAKFGIIHKNNAANKKSRLQKQVNKILAA
jgi:small subunit ribosomal protein S20